MFTYTLMHITKFFVQVGENTPKEKAKISKAQREIEDEKREKEKEEKRND